MINDHLRSKNEDSFVLTLTWPPATTLRTGRPKSRATAYRPVWEVPCRLGETRKTREKTRHPISNKWRPWPPQLLEIELCALPTWWFWRGGCTRSHSEHGRETPQRRWYFDLSHGRVGRCQVCKSQNSIGFCKRKNRISPRRRLRRPKSRNSRQRPDKNGPPLKAAICCFTNKACPGKSPENKGQSDGILAWPKTRYGRQRRRTTGAGWSSPVARQAHNLKAAGSNPAPATKITLQDQQIKPPSGGFSILYNCLSGCSKNYQS